jgi:hypothetical protein
LSADPTRMSKVAAEAQMVPITGWIERHMSIFDILPLILNFSTEKSLLVFEDEKLWQKNLERNQHSSCVKPQD